MATNPYFKYGKINNEPTNEQALYEKLIIESIKMYGHDFYYIPRNVISVDEILNEDIESRFEEFYELELYIESTEGWEGDNDLLSKFGLEMRDEATVVIARRRFQQEVTGENDPLAPATLDPDIHPNEGDLIYLPMTKSLFEIKFVEHEAPFYQLENLPVYKMNIEKFEYRGEDIDTGNDLIDDFQVEYSSLTTIESLVFDDSLAAFAKGDTVTISWGNQSPRQFVTAEVLKIEEDDIISVGQVKSTDGEVHILSGMVDIENDASPSVTASGVIFDELNNKDIYTNDEPADNYEFEDAGNDLIDFSESNPFGEPNA